MQRHGDVMDDRARAILDEARETLHRVRNVEVQYRDHDDDALLKWRSGMPTERPVTLADVEQKIAEQRVITREVMAAAIAHERKARRAEMNELHTVLRDLLMATDA